MSSPDLRASRKSSMLSCRCLNVKFNIGFLRDISEAELSLINSEVRAHFDDHNIKVLLEDTQNVMDGAQVSVVSLVQKRCVNDWTFYHCFNCKVFTHASYAKNYLVVVNYGGMIGLEEQKMLFADPNYFDLYGIVLKHRQKTDEQLKSLKPSVVAALHNIQDTVSDFIKYEEKQMEQRITEYTALQRAAFDDLNVKVLGQRKMLEQLVCAAYWDTNEDADSAFERSVEEISSLVSGSAAKAAHSTRSDSVVDDMFDLDPFNDQDSPNDYDDEDDDEDLPNYKSRREAGTAGSDVLAKSMPIRVPGMYGRPKSVQHAASDSSDDETPGLEDMQASIKALAQSVGTDGTEMFGDLPRHAFNKYSSRHY